MSTDSPYWLPPQPDVPDDIARQVAADYARFAEGGLPAALPTLLRDRYGIDIASQYAGFDVSNPFGKASGQLSMTSQQVAEDVTAGLGFVVLKTVIARDESGSQSMAAWAVKESRMVAEPVVGKRGEPGWTINWKGRGWWQTFDEYLRLITDAQRIAENSDTLIVPSCKYHLPTPDEDGWKTDEYDYTTRKLYHAWSTAGDSTQPMPIEKDFSPTLAGSDRSAMQSQILEWLRRVPALIRGTDSQTPVRVGLKLFNSLFDDGFQLEMLRTIHETVGEMRADFFVYGNRLFDPNREFDGHRGIAYGGPDLSDRNVRVMSRFLRESTAAGPLLPFSATGNINSGRMAMEYALRGAENFQLHTYFQLPADQFTMRTGGKTEKALHELFFHPQDGFIIWLHHLARALGNADRPIRFRDVVGRGWELAG